MSFGISTILGPFKLREVLPADPGGQGADRDTVTAMNGCHAKTPVRWGSEDAFWAVDIFRDTNEAGPMTAEEYHGPTQPL